MKLIKEYYYEGGTNRYKLFDVTVMEGVSCVYEITKEEIPEVISKLAEHAYHTIEYWYDDESVSDEELIDLLAKGELTKLNAFIRSDWEIKGVSFYTVYKIIS